MSAPPPQGAAVLYVASRFPALSETFVYREVLALRAAGRRVEVATLRAPAPDAAASGLAERLGPAVPVYGRGAAGIAADVVAEAVLHPLATLRTLGAVLRDACTARDAGLRGRAVLPFQAAAALSLARRARALGAARIHAHMANAPATVAMYAAVQLGIPFSFTGHANDLFVDRCFLSEKLRRAAFVACISRWHREFYRTVRPMTEERLPIVRCGVDVVPGASPRPAGDRLRVCGVGRLVPKKGFRVLAEAARAVAAQGVAFDLEIVGDGPERAALESAAAAVPAPGAVRLAGALPHDEVLRRVRDADLFVLPCVVDPDGDRDGIPVALMEAMAAGVPVVAGDLPAVRELVRDGDTGRLVPPGDAAALAAVIADLARDAAGRARLGASGRAWVRDEFSTPVNTARLGAAFAGAAR